MQPFGFSWANSVEEATSNISAHEGTRFLGGGTNLVDLMKLHIEQPQHLIDINGLDLKKIERSSSGGLRIGALVPNSDLAYDDTVRSQYPVLSQAILSGASPQLRNRATTGGNLMQRTRCPYFYDTAYKCNKRQPGSGCDAINGYNRSHAILGTSDNCIATHPSDMCVALVALDAQVQVRSANHERTIPIRDFHLLPGNTPEKETALAHDELITHIILSPALQNTRSCYLKIRDRSSYEFALASAAVLLSIQNGYITKAAIALGGIGTKPWRSTEAEKILEGSKPGRKLYEAVAEAALKDAKEYKHNAFKTELAKRTLVSALTTAEGTI
jgi:xanthine dehydrogenase YagS FAD-binding subunit